MSRPKKTSDPVIRFFDQVEKTPTCWIWIGFKLKASRSHDLVYGRIKINGVPWSVHRYSFTLHHRPIPAGMVVRHTCDNPLCVNPAHLVLGTQGDNVRDCIARGRFACGSDLRTAKLTDEAVRTIRVEYKPYDRKHGAASLAKRYGVDSTIVSDVIHRKRWKHV